jgi:protein-S-isoprenylcysteine O-methyltransferase Ste14
VQKHLSNLVFIRRARDLQLLCKAEAMLANAGLALLRRGGAVTREKLHDLIAASPVILWFGVGAVGSLSRVVELLGAEANPFLIGCQLANVAFLLVAIALLALRIPPVKKQQGAGPVLAGVIGCLVPFVVVLLPQRALPPGILTALSALGLLGAALSICVLFWLGRSFSILPQARKLVTKGPYRFVRHPLYLAEFLIVASRASELAQPWPLVAFAFAVCCQLPRMRYEERILAEAFPDYSDYARRTARLIPGVY